MSQSWRGWQAQGQAAFALGQWLGEELELGGWGGTQGKLGWEEQRVGVLGQLGGRGQLVWEHRLAGGIEMGQQLGRDDGPARKELV